MSRMESITLFATCFMLVSCLAYSSTLKMEATGLLKRVVTFNGLHGHISQKIELFIHQVLYSIFRLGGKLVPTQFPQTLVLTL
jgi:hypothetical protein